MISIRRATVADAAPISALTLQLGYPANESAIQTRLTRLLPDPAQLVLVAVSGDTIIGWLHAHAYTALEAGAQVEIVGLVVSAQHQRCGAGRALVAAAECWASTKGTGVIIVRSNVRREESHRFYLALGFAHSKTQAVYQKPGDVPAA